MSFAGISVIRDTEAAPCSASSAAAVSSTVDSGYHLLLIQGYSRTHKDAPNGKRIKSRPFNVGGHTWIIWYYPNGCEPDNSGYISLYLFLEGDQQSTSDPVTVQFEFSFIDQVEKQRPSHLRATRPRRVSDKGGWGYPKFVRRTDLKRSKHLKNDSFTIRCDIVVASVLPSASPNINQHLSSLLQTGEGADVTFNVSGETVMAHRCLLAARSPVFRAMFFGPMKITGGAVRIDDVNPDVFKLLLTFIYSDSVPEDAGHDGTEVIWRRLFLAADTYDLPKLKLICAEKLLVTATAAPNIHQHLSRLLLTGDGADVTFNVCGETVEAHRCVLAARSPVFRAMLFGPMKEGTTTGAVRIDDMNPDMFKLLLTFIYNDSVPDDVDHDGAEAIWQDLLVAADIYDIPKLKLICGEKICEDHIDRTTVVDILALAEQHHCPALKEACLDFLDSSQDGSLLFNWFHI